LIGLDYDQSKQELTHQYRVGYHALTRFKALEKLLSDSIDSATVGLFIEALDDPFWAIRQLAVNVFESYPGDQTEELVSKLNAIAKSDSKSLVRADAITTLSSFPNDVVHLPLYLEAMKDSSYAVAGAGLSAYLQIDHPERKERAQQFENENNIQLVIPLADYYALNHVPAKYSWYHSQLEEASGELMYYLVNYFGQYLVDATLEEQSTGATYLEDLGINHGTYYVRFSAFQALSLLDEVEGVPEMKRRVKESETDPRLQDVYAQIP
jgi:aminopeptidase N